MFKVDNRGMISIADFEQVDSDMVIKLKCI